MLNWRRKAGCTAIAICALDACFAADVPCGATLKEERVDCLLARLTLAEKVSLLTGGSAPGTAAVERLGIPTLHFADGPNGVRSNDGDAATAFPVGVALAASWDVELTSAVGTAIGEEARALNDQVLLGPNLNLVRSPLSGRNFETYGEDPWLASRLGVSFVQGLQSAGVGASIKHYVGNEQETERERGSSNIGTRTLHEIYLLPFEAAVLEARP